MKDLSAITKIMVLAERWRTAGGREEHHALKDQLFWEIERLADERYDAGRESARESDRHADALLALEVIPSHLFTTPSPCPTCQALARAVMMDQTGKA